MQLAPGHAITPHLRLVREVGRGGMGSVWVADHLTLDTEVAVKFISAALVGSEGALERFSREARIFLDGHEDMVPLGLGDVLDFSLSPEPLRLLGISARRKWGRQPAVG